MHVKGLMEGKKGIVMGVANHRSIAWMAASACGASGAQVALTYQNDAVKKRVLKLGETIDCPLSFKCDVSSDEDVEKSVKLVKESLGTIDFLVHAIAWSDKEQLGDDFFTCTEENFTETMKISAYSLVKVAKAFMPLMHEGSSILTYTYLGAKRFVSGYNMMGIAKAALETSVIYLATAMGKHGIRVNAISAGSMRTLASSAIAKFHYIQKLERSNAPLRRSVEPRDIQGSSLYMLSDMSSGVTGEIHYVDVGYNKQGARLVESLDIETFEKM